MNLCAAAADDATTDMAENRCFTFRLFFSVYLLSDAGVLLLRGFILLSIALLAALEPAFYPL